MWLLSPDTKVVSISITITWNKQYQMTNLPFESRSSYPLTSDTLSMVAICITISQQSRRLARRCPKWLWSLCATNSNIGLGRILADLQERSRHEELRDSKQRWRRMKARTKRKTSTSTNTRRGISPSVVTSPMIGRPFLCLALQPPPHHVGGIILFTHWPFCVPRLSSLPSFLRSSHIFNLHTWPWSAAPFPTAWSTCDIPNRHSKRARRVVNKTSIRLCIVVLRHRHIASR